MSGGFSATIAPFFNRTGSNVVVKHWTGRVRAGYLFLPFAAIAFHAFGLDTPYRTTMYLNIVLVVLIAVRQGDWLRAGDRGMLAATVSMPLVLVVLHLLAGGTGAKEMRHLLAASFLAIGIWQLASVPPADAKLESRLRVAALLGVIGYVAIQSVLTFATSHHYGTTKNPHYLAQYCLLLIPVAAYLLQRSSPPVRLAMGAALIALLALLLETSSRPAWLALMLVTLLVLGLRRRLLSWQAALVVLAVGALYLVNAGGFASRVDDLYAHIGTEERVHIWRDTWTAQQASTGWQWFVGHGFDSFKDGFRSFSKRDYGVDFNAPHNFPLELLYTSGIIGLAAVAIAVAGLYRLGFRLYLDTGRSSFVLALLAGLTVNLAFVSVTIGFFTSYNLLPLATVAGLLLALKRTLARQESRGPTSPAGPGA